MTVLKKTFLPALPALLALLMLAFAPAVQAAGSDKKSSTPPASSTPPPASGIWTIIPGLGRANPPKPAAPAPAASAAQAGPDLPIKGYAIPIGGAL